MVSKSNSLFETSTPKILRPRFTQIRPSAPTSFCPSVSQVGLIIPETYRIGPGGSYISNSFLVIVDHNPFDQYDIRKLSGHQ